MAPDAKDAATRSIKGQSSGRPIGGLEQQRQMKRCAADEPEHEASRFKAAQDGAGKYRRQGTGSRDVNQSEYGNLLRERLRQCNPGAPGRTKPYNREHLLVSAWNMRTGSGVNDL